MDCYTRIADICIVKESVNCNNPTANMIKTQNGKESSSDYDHQK